MTQAIDIRPTTAGTSCKERPAFIRADLAEAPMATLNPPVARMRIGVVGLGGAGSLILQQLAHLGGGVVVDRNCLEPSNLNRVVGTQTVAVGTPDWNEVVLSASAMGGVGALLPTMAAPGSLSFAGTIRLTGGGVCCIDTISARSNALLGGLESVGTRGLLWEGTPVSVIRTVLAEEQPTLGQAVRLEVDASHAPTITAEGFEELFRSRSASRSALFDSIARSADPMDLLDAVLVAFERNGNQDRLDLGARLLSEMDARALPALRRLVRESFDGQDAFVDLIVHSASITDAERRALVMQLARSPLQETRDRLVEAVGSLPPDLARDVVRRLNDGRR